MWHGLGEHKKATSGLWSYKTQKCEERVIIEAQTCNCSLPMSKCRGCWLKILVFPQERLVETYHWDRKPDWPAKVVYGWSAGTCKRAEGIKCLHHTCSELLSDPYILYQCRPSTWIQGVTLHLGKEKRALLGRQLSFLFMQSREAPPCVFSWEGG